MKPEITSDFDESSSCYNLRNYLRKMEGLRAIKTIEKFRRREMESSQKPVLDAVSLNLKEWLVNGVDIESLRKIDPVSVCCFNVARGVLDANKLATIDDAIRIGKLSHPVFKELLALGIIPAELEYKSHD